ncbi:glycosyltransferase family 2 protein [Modicisalibacter radicis]|uniref:glycosyltransferase family 2 protein n=1 Tax=Halomonas sp. EAR18 TaxID=2518972 RepID=UPI00109CBEEC|nr:glycosyltransferase family A protein [Halomonas sp. EAR18]
MNDPLFSVVIPVYNAQATIEATLESVLLQRLQNFEVVLVDDGSTDGSLSLLRSWQRRDRRLVVIDQANAGVSAARNAGAARASGEWIAFLDADDLWHPDKLQEHQAFHERHPDVDISFAKVAFIPSSGSEKAKTFSRVPKGVVDLECVLGENPVCTSSNIVVRKRSWLASGGFVEGMNHAEDQEWLARCVARGMVLRGLSSALVGYRMSGGGLSVNLEAMFAGWWDLARHHEANCDLPRAKAIYCRYLARRALRAGLDPACARYYALAGLRSSPRGFLDDHRRGILTLVGVLVSPLLSRQWRCRLFS